MVPDHAGAAPGIRGAVMHAGSASHGALKILLHYPVLNTGGAEHSTLRLLSALVERGCEVHLVLTVGAVRSSPGSTLGWPCTTCATASATCRLA